MGGRVRGARRAAFTAALRSAYPLRRVSGGTGGGPRTDSGYCGSASAISNQLLFDPTQTCAVIRTSSPPASPPIRTRIHSGSASTRPKIPDPQTEQTPARRGRSVLAERVAPARSRNACTEIRAFAVKAVPVSRRHWLNGSSARRRAARRPRSGPLRRGSFLLRSSCSSLLTRSSARTSRNIRAARACRSAMSSTLLTNQSGSMRRTTSGGRSNAA